MAETDSSSTPSLWLTSVGEENTSSLFPGVFSGSRPSSDVGFIGQGAYARVPTAYDPRDVCVDLIVAYVCCESVMRGRSRWQRLAASHASAALYFSQEHRAGLDDGIGLGKEPYNGFPTQNWSGFWVGKPFSPSCKSPSPVTSITLKTTPNLTLEADGSTPDSDVEPDFPHKAHIPSQIQITLSKQRVGGQIGGQMGKILSQRTWLHPCSLPELNLHFPAT